jgi:hypothetical protein
VRCGECPHQAFIPPDEDIIEKHLRGGATRSGDFVAGVYPLLQDETCWFLAVDFDGDNWADDARALLNTCHAKGIWRRICAHNSLCKQMTKGRGRRTFFDVN